MCGGGHSGGPVGGPVGVVINTRGHAWLCRFGVMLGRADLRGTARWGQLIAAA